jgi:hypothetical protein
MSEGIKLQVQRTVQSFVARITELARRAAIDTLSAAFAERGARPRRVAAAAVTARGRCRLVGRAGRPRGVGGAKRTPAELEALSARFASFVQANPGLRIEQINRQLGTRTKDLALPIRKLLADGVINVQGQKRSTLYFGNPRAQNSQAMRAALS